MKYTKSYPKGLPEALREAKALNDVEFWMSSSAFKVRGVRGLVNLIMTEISFNECQSLKQIARLTRFVCSFAGIRGYPARVILRIVHEKRKMEG